MDVLSGWKTYIIVAVGVALYGAEAMGIIPAGTTDKLDELLLFLGLGTLRAGIKKAEPPK